MIQAQIIDFYNRWRTEILFLILYIILLFFYFNDFFLYFFFESYYSYKALFLDSFLQYFCKCAYEPLNCKNFNQLESHFFFRVFLYSKTAEINLINQFLSNEADEKKTLLEFQYYDDMVKYISSKTDKTLQKGVLSYTWLQCDPISDKTPPFLKLILIFKNEVLVCKMDSLTEIDIPESDYFPPSYATIEEKTEIRDAFSRIEELKYGDYFFKAIMQESIVPKLSSKFSKYLILLREEKLDQFYNEIFDRNFFHNKDATEYDYKTYREFSKSKFNLRGEEPIFYFDVYSISKDNSLKSNLHIFVFSDAVVTIHEPNKINLDEIVYHKNLEVFLENLHFFRDEQMFWGCYAYPLDEKQNVFTSILFPREEFCLTNDLKLKRMLFFSRDIWDQFIERYKSPIYGRGVNNLYFFESEDEMNNFLSRKELWDKPYYIRICYILDLDGKLLVYNVLTDKNYNLYFCKREPEYFFLEEIYNYFYLKLLSIHPTIKDVILSFNINNNNDLKNAANIAYEFTQKSSKIYRVFFLSNQSWNYFAQYITHYGVLSGKHPMTFADEKAFLDFLKKVDLNLNEVENIYICYSILNEDHGKTIVVKIYIFDKQMFLVRSDKIETSQIPIIEMWEKNLNRPFYFQFHEKYDETIIFEEVHLNSIDQDYDVLVTNKLKILTVFNNKKMNDIFLFSNENFFIERWIKHLAIKDFYSRNIFICNSLKEFFFSKANYNMQFKEYSFLSLHQIDQGKLANHAFALISHNKILILKTDFKAFKTLILNKNIGLSIEEQKKDNFFTKQFDESAFSNWFFLFKIKNSFWFNQVPYLSSSKNSFISNLTEIPGKLLSKDVDYNRLKLINFFYYREKVSLFFFDKVTFNKQINFWEEKHNIRVKANFTTKEAFFKFMVENNLSLSSNINENSSINCFYYDSLKKKVEKTQYFLINNFLIGLENFEIKNDITSVENMITKSETIDNTSDFNKRVLILVNEEFHKELVRSPLKIKLNSFDGKIYSNWNLFKFELESYNGDSLISYWLDPVSQKIVIKVESDDKAFKILFNGKIKDLPLEVLNTIIFIENNSCEKIKC